MPLDNICNPLYNAWAQGEGRHIMHLEYAELVETLESTQSTFEDESRFFQLAYTEQADAKDEHDRIKADIERVVAEATIVDPKDNKPKLQFTNAEARAVEVKRRLGFEHLRLVTRLRDAERNKRDHESKRDVAQERLKSLRATLHYVTAEIERQTVLMQTAPILKLAETPPPPEQPLPTRPGSASVLSVPMYPYQESTKGSASVQATPPPDDEDLPF